MNTEKKTKAQRIAELEQKLEEAEAYLIYRHHFASKVSTFNSRSFEGA